MIGGWCSSSGKRSWQPELMGDSGDRVDGFERHLESSSNNKLNV